MFSWWFRKGITPRRKYSDLTRFRVYDYEGISLAQPGTREEVLNTALFYARNAGVAWIFLSYEPQDAQAFEADHAFFERELGAHPEVSVPIDRRVGWILDTIVMKLESRTPRST